MNPKPMNPETPEPYGPWTRALGLIGLGPLRLRFSGLRVVAFRHGLGFRVRV